MSEYPEHERLAAIKEASHAQGAFLDWLFEHGYCLARWREDKDGDYFLVPVHRRVDEILARYHGIDLATLEDEKRAMLERLRAANAEAH